MSLGLQRLSTALLLLVVGGGVYGTHLRLQRHTASTSDHRPEVLPSPEALRVMSLGYRSLVADYYWLRAISHFGTRAMHERGYPSLEPLLRRVLYLDPYYTSAYVFAGAVLTLPGQSVQASLDLLEQGLRMRPGVWKIPFFLGFNAYYFAQDYGRAARALTQAAKLEGAPPYTAALALRLSAEAGEPEVGLAFIETALETVQDATLRQLYLERHRQLLLELHLKHLNAAARELAQRQGRPPIHLDELVQAGLLRELPEEPLGARYYVDPSGAVRTTSQAQRLQLPEAAKGAKP